MKNLATILLAMVVGVMIAPHLASAIDRQTLEENRISVNRDAYNKGYLDNLDDIDDDAVYQASSEYRVVKLANESLRRIKEKL